MKKSNTQQAIDDLKEKLSAQTKALEEARLALSIAQQKLDKTKKELKTHL